ncbi:hypothetical protein JIN84_00080 [Luteolibacter yonseiensis]|uniref:PEP-CTERM protein-sorting domain-containing protein n=1 Tax=Luteolibacter yonseiensis TaxID=1144680 RepID=A0A934R0P5_9BACT|nr:hypothetical protein [Luteolibacter yonseiensis]MBK1814003.1 hypothetical protein [Luteolibacter yonseiensis]
MIKVSIVFVSTTLASACFSSGATLFTSGDYNNPGLGFVSSPYASQYIAAQFIVTNAISLTGINVAGRYGGVAQDDQFSIAIMADSGNSMPGELVDNYVFSSIPSTRSALSSGEGYINSLNLSSAITLGAGTYWLAVANGSSSYWSWLNSLSSGTLSASSSTFLTSGYLPFNDAPVPFIFNLEGSVIPEPSALVLGLFGLDFLTRRKRF